MGDAAAISTANRGAKKKVPLSNYYSTLKDDDAGDKLVTKRQKLEKQESQLERKEKCPPIFVKGDTPTLRTALRECIANGTLKCTLKLCSGGLKLMAESKHQYQKLLDILNKEVCEYFTHDIPSDKPFKAILRGLDDRKTDEVQQLLVECGLIVTGVFKIARQDKSRRYRDQLYLIHLRHGSVTLKDLKRINVIDSIVIEWQRYKPVHRDVTQCTNCCGFGHGTRNCHLAPRCIKCGDKHQTEKCLWFIIAKNPDMHQIDVKCANCGAKHEATAKECPARAEFVEIRKKASSKNLTRRQPPVINDQNFPSLVPPRHTTKISQPVNSWPAVPPGLRQNNESKPAPTEDAPPLYTPEQLLPMFNQLVARLRSCKTRMDQIMSLGMFVIENGI